MACVRLGYKDLRSVKLVIEGSFLERPSQERLWWVSRDMLVAEREIP